MWRAIMTCFVRQIWILESQVLWEGGSTQQRQLYMQEKKKKVNMIEVHE